MSGSKEIRVKIRSVQNTQKITRAMEMVAASKMKKAQERMRAARPYREKILEVCAHVSEAVGEYRHPYLVRHDRVEGVGLIVVTTDKGLCGGLNANTLRSALGLSQRLEGEGKRLSYTVFGNKGVSFLNRFKANVISSAVGLGDDPQLERMLGAITTMLDAYSAGEVDQVNLLYSQFENTMKQTPRAIQLLPLGDLSAESPGSSPWDYIYEPDAKQVLDVLLKRYIESVIYACVIENIASEQSARMVAMKAATDNAGKLISELNLIYNKTRQAAITQEIAEIVGGAAAV